MDEWPFEFLRFIERPAPIFSHVAAVRQGLSPFGCRAFSIRVEPGNSRRVWLSILHKQRAALEPYLREQKPWIAALMTCGIDNESYQVKGAYIETKALTPADSALLEGSEW